MRMLRRIEITLSLIILSKLRYGNMDNMCMSYGYPLLFGANGDGIILILKAAKCI